MSEPLNDPTVNPPDQPAPLKRRCVLVCQHRSCLRVGSADVLATFQAATAPEIFVSASDCLGQCGSGPTVKIAPDSTWYCRVKPADVPTIVEQHLQADEPVESLLHPRFHPRIDAFSPQD